MTTAPYLCRVIQRNDIHFNPSRRRAKTNAVNMFIEIKTLLAIEMIASENPEGFTLHVPTMQLVTSGVVVAYHETQNQFGMGGLHTCVKHALYNSGFVGGWRNPEGRMQYDSVRIFWDLRKAVKWGRKQQQVAIFDLDNGWEIIL